MPYSWFLFVLVVLASLYWSFGLHKRGARTKALLLYWACLLVELLFVFDQPQHTPYVVLIGVTLVAGAVTIFALPGER